MYIERDSKLIVLLIGFRVLVEQLEKVNVSKMEIDAQTAFWINVYNALVMHVRSANCDISRSHFLYC